MKISRAILICGAALLAACDGLYDGGKPGGGAGGEVPKANPTDDMKLMFLGVPARDDRAGNLINMIASGKDFTFNDRLYQNVNTGFGAPLVRSLRQGGIDGIVNIDLFASQSGDDRCKDAKEQKILWHQSQGTGIPSAFGKFTDVKLKSVRTKGAESWLGYVELCTWIENGDTMDEYFWHIDLKDDGPTNTTQTYLPPFSGTLDLAGLIDDTEVKNTFAIWDYKIHGKEKAVVIASVSRNGNPVNQAIEPNVYLNDENCFDMFLNNGQITKLRATGSIDFGDQAGYCMGRCDGLIMNTK